jgi:hypothetical protein
MRYGPELSPIVLQAHRCIKILGTMLLVIAVWVLAFAVGTGITAFATPWDEFVQGVE